MFFRQLVLASLKPLCHGTLTVHLPDDTQRVFGGLGQGLAATLVVTHENFFRRCVLFGPIGFAEGYLAGECESPDLTKLIAWFILNAEHSAGLKTRSGRNGGWINLCHAANRLLHLRRPNSRTRSRDNIRDHYDLSNDFFRLWLDPSLTYSSALFERPDMGLEEAQQAKYDALCRKLQLTESDHVLEIGTGWGGFSLHAAATYGCRITTITISEQQHAEAARRIEAAGLADRITLRLCDYRDVQGQFDKIASIEMLEAVGDRYVDGFFADCDRLLKPRGLLGLQAILCPDRQYPILRDGVDFIQKHIFPGSLLMSLGRITEATRKAGDLNLLDYRDMAPDYAHTLRLWRDAFEDRRDEVLALGFDETFLRKWRYYLCYCEAAFGTRHITVAQMVFSRPDNLNLRSAFYDLVS